MSDGNDAQIQKIQRLLRNFKQKLKLLEQLLLKSDIHSSHSHSSNSRNQYTYSKNTKIRNWESLKLLPSLNKFRNQSFDGLNLKDLNDKILNVKQSYKNILNLNDNLGNANKFPSLVELSAKVIGYSIINCDLKDINECYEDFNQLNKDEIEGKQIEVVSHVYSCVPSHLRSLLVPSHALSLIFSNDIISDHHATISSLLSISRPYELEFQDVIHQTLLCAFARSTLPPPDYVIDLAQKFNALPYITRSLQKLLPAFEPALSTCRAIDNLRSLNVANLSDLIYAIFIPCLDAPLPPIKLINWIDVKNTNSLLHLALKVGDIYAQQVLIEITSMALEKLLNDPKNKLSWYNLTFNLACASILILRDGCSLQQTILGYLEDSCHLPFTIYKTLNSSIRDYNIDLTLGDDYSRCGYLIEMFGKRNLTPAQISLLKYTISRNLSVDGFNNHRLSTMLQNAHNKFEIVKGAFMHHYMSFETPIKHPLTVDITPMSNNRDEFLTSTPRYTPFLKRRTKPMLAPKVVQGKHFNFNAANKLYGFGSPVIVERKWKDRLEEDDNDIDIKKHRKNNNQSNKITHISEDDDESESNVESKEKYNEKEENFTSESSSSEYNENSGSDLFSEHDESDFIYYNENRKKNTEVDDESVDDLMFYERIAECSPKSKKNHDLTVEITDSESDSDKYYPRERKCRNDLTLKNKYNDNTTAPTRRRKSKNKVFNEDDSVASKYKNRNKKKRASSSSSEDSDYGALKRRKSDMNLIRPRSSILDLKNGNNVRYSTGTQLNTKSKYISNYNKPHYSKQSPNHNRSIYKSYKYNDDVIDLSSDPAYSTEDEQSKKLYKPPSTKPNQQEQPRLRPFMFSIV